MLRFDNDCASVLESAASHGRDERTRETRFRFAVTMPARTASIASVTDSVTQVLDEHQWPQDDIDAVEVAIREALANAIRHGCRGDATLHIRCSFAYEDGDALLLVVRDPGSGFDPARVADPLDAANTLNLGGRGILLMRALMDDVQFVDGGREVRMRKRKGAVG